MEIVDRALTIIENYCGCSFRETHVNERVSLTNSRGRLTHEPVIRITAIKVRASKWAFSDAFGSSDWMELNPDELLYKDQIFVVTGGILHSSFTEADVDYDVGYSELPVSVKQAHDLLVSHIQDSGTKTTYSMSSLITPEIAELLAPYTTRNGGYL